MGRPARAVDLARPAAMPSLEKAARQTGALANPFQLFWRERLLPLASGNDADLATIGVDQGLMPMIFSCFGWRCHDDASGTNASALLALIDEGSHAKAKRDCFDLMALARRLRSGGTVTVEVANEVTLRDRLADRLGHLGFRLLRETRGPSLPLFSVDYRASLPSGWIATFVRCAADTEFR